MSAKTLWDISSDMEALDELLANDCTDEEAAAIILKWSEENLQNLEGKADNYCALIRTMEARAKARTDEAKRLRDRAKIDEANARRLKDRLQFVFGLRNIRKLETERFTIAIQKNGGVQALEVDPTKIGNLPQDCQRITIEADNEAIRKKLEMGIEFDGVRLLPRGESLRIK